MKKLVYIAITLLTGQLSFAQVKFIESGKVEYEKKMNQYRLLDDEGDNIWIQEQKKALPKLVTDYYELSFNKHKSVYKLEKETTTNKYMWGWKPNDADVIVQNLDNNSISSQRDVFENTYLIADSVRHIEWKIENETREIAGFNCRKAVGIMCDSVYVVAFYTDEIMVSSGPESFGGLPGLILGFAVPRLYATWFATKVELAEPTSGQLNPKQKGKKVSYEQLNKELMKGLDDWGKEGAKRIWNAML